MIRSGIAGIARTALLVFAGLVAGTSAAAMQMSVEEQIAAAVLPLGREHRDEATVFGYRDGSHLEVLRWGSNGFVCESDRPGDARYQVRCFDAALTRFIRRRDELNAAGIQGEARWELMDAEVKTGILELPSGSIEVSLKGRINASTGVADSLTITHYIYLPFATPESTGLSTTDGGDGKPYLMDPGHLDAHMHVPGPTRPFRRGSKVR